MHYERRFIIFVDIFKAMKSALILRFSLTLPFLFFLELVIMAIFGCISMACGASDEFICGTYCTIGKAMAGVLTLYFIYLILRDLKSNARK